MHPDYTIRLARTSDLDALPPIERAAAQLFTTVGWEDNHLLQDATSVEEHRVYLAAHRLWVAVDAADQPVGFAAVSMVDGHGHLDEVDVHPEHGQRGIGRALVAQVCAWAQAAQLGAVTLTTERDIPWNAPFYARLGFEIMPHDEHTEELRAILAAEAALGLDPATRVVMIRAV